MKPEKGKVSCVTLNYLDFILSQWETIKDLK